MLCCGCVCLKFVVLCFLNSVTQSNSEVKYQFAVCTHSSGFFLLHFLWVFSLTASFHSTATQLDNRKNCLSVAPPSDTMSNQSLSLSPLHLLLLRKTAAAVISTSTAPLPPPPTLSSRHRSAVIFHSSAHPLCRSERCGVFPHCRDY